MSYQPLLNFQSLYRNQSLYGQVKKYFFDNPFFYIGFYPSHVIKCCVHLLVFRIFSNALDGSPYTQVEKTLLGLITGAACHSIDGFAQAYNPELTWAQLYTILWNLTDIQIERGCDSGFFSGSCPLVARQKSPGGYFEPAG